MISQDGAWHELRQMLHQRQRIVVFTGAGVSTASGIPDFRGPQGVWKRRQPVYFQEFMASEDKRVEHWDYKLEGWKAFCGARPNAAHQALAQLELQGRLHLLITQNIDGLHTAAGNTPERIVELHGTNRDVECLSCGARSDARPSFEEFARTRRCPLCKCGGWLKTATVSFGQSLPEGVLQRAFQAAVEADLFLSVGSSLTVEPAASIPLAAVGQGIPYAIINRGTTAHDHLATMRIEADVSEALPALLAPL